MTNTWSGRKKRRKPPGEDERMVRLAIDGDYDAFEKLVIKYESRVYSHCMKFMVNTADAEDALQETFLQTYKSLSTFRGEAAFSTWLMKIATNNCLMRLRKRKKYDVISLDKPIEFNGSELQREVVDWSRNPMVMCGNEEMGHILNKAIKALPEDKRVVLVLKDVEGFSNLEISDMLGMTVAAVKSRLHRARLFTRDFLSKHLLGDEVELTKTVVEK